MWVNQPQTFAHIRSGAKTVEGRLWKGSLRTLKINQIIYVCCQHETVPVRVRHIKRYKTFKQLLSYKDNLKKTLCDVSTVDEGILHYHTIYDKKNIVLHGVVGITIERLVMTLI